MTLSKPSKVLLSIVFISIQILTWFWWFELRFNLSGSMPIGLYRLKAHQIPQRGDWVAACLPSDMVRVPMNQHHLHRGNCPSGVEPVLKQIIGMPDDKVTLTGSAIIINGKVYAAPKLIQEMPNTNAGYWLYGVSDPIHSWDSRYFGAVTAEAIQGVVKPLWVKTPVEMTVEWDSTRYSTYDS